MQIFESRSCEKISGKGMNFDLKKLSPKGIKPTNARNFIWTLQIQSYQCSEYFPIGRWSYWSKITFQMIAFKIILLTKWLYFLDGTFVYPLNGTFVQPPGVLSNLTSFVKKKSIVFFSRKFEYSSYAKHFSSKYT